MPRASSKGATWGVSHPWGHRPTRRRHWIGPKRLVIWRFAKPLLRKPAPHCGQRGQCVGCWLRSANTASTRWLVSTRATCHAARINTVREWASSTALRKRCTAGSSSCMVSCKHSIGHRSPLEPLAKEFKSVPFFRCYASPPRTEMSARRASWLEAPYPHLVRWRQSYNPSGRQTAPPDGRVRPPRVWRRHRRAARRYSAPRQPLEWQRIHSIRGLVNRLRGCLSDDRNDGDHGASHAHRHRRHFGQEAPRQPHHQQQEYEPSQSRHLENLLRAGTAPYHRPVT